MHDPWLCPRLSGCKTGVYQTTKHSCIRVVCSVAACTQGVGVQEEPCEQQSPIKKNQIIRMNHVTTGKWLHSHNLASPLSQNAEVSAYGAPSKSDTGDYWVVSWDGSGKTWQRDAKVRRWFPLNPVRTFVFHANHRLLESLMSPCETEWPPSASANAGQVTHRDVHRCTIIYVNCNASAGLLSTYGYQKVVVRHWQAIQQADFRSA